MYLTWLNRIECEFAALRYFALYGTGIAATTSGTRRSRAASAGLTSTPDPFATPPSAPRSGARITCLTRPNDRPGRRDGCRLCRRGERKRTEPDVGALV